MSCTGGAMVVASLPHCRFDVGIERRAVPRVVLKTLDYAEASHNGVNNTFSNTNTM
jgi:hypothetical protein